MAAHRKEWSLTCGVNANILSCKEYSLLVLRIPTSLDLRPDNPSFLLRPKIEQKIFCEKSSSYYDLMN